jgi:hypothetical protein
MESVSTGAVLQGGRTHAHDDIEGGRYGGDTRLRILGTYSKELGRNITRKFSAMSSQISRRPTAVVATEKPESFTILPEETQSPTPQEVSQPSPESRADVVKPSSIIGVPIMPVHAITASRPTSSATFSTASGMTETGHRFWPSSTHLHFQSLHVQSQRSTASTVQVKYCGVQGRTLPKPPALDLSRQGSRRQYGLPTANNRLESMRPRSRSKSAIIDQNKP